MFRECVAWREVLKNVIFGVGSPGSGVIKGQNHNFEPKFLHPKGFCGTILVSGDVGYPGELKFHNWSVWATT